MKTALAPSSQTSCSNPTAYDLIENFLLGWQTKKIDKIMNVFHPDVEYRGHPEKPIFGVTLLKYITQSSLKETEEFNFKIKSVIWNDASSSGSASIEYQFINTKTKKGKRVYEIALFKTENNLITYYLSSPTVLPPWKM